jgi:steroid 5-alpha reductase family enzyme
MLGLIFFTTICVLVYMTFWWFLATLRKNNSFADVAWGTIFVLIVLALFSRLDYVPLTFVIVFLLVIVWGIRLFIHIGRRNLLSPEDRRYAQWRAKGGKNYQIFALPKIFWFQGLIALVISAPLFISARYGNDSISWTNLLGLLIWIFGFAYEATADKQLRIFLKTKKPGEIMDKGLWEYSRHPNYFGEICQWLGLFIIVSGYSYGWVAVISPLLLSYLLAFVSGVPLAEKGFKGNRAYEGYAHKTNAIIPRFN